MTEEPDPDELLRYMLVIMLVLVLGVPLLAWLLS